MVVLSTASAQRTDLRRDGFYYTVEKTGGRQYQGVMEPARTWIHFWFFYEDGSFTGIVSGPAQNDSIIGPEYLARRSDSLRIVFSDKDNVTHGRYIIRGDSLQITSLSLKSSGFGSMGKVHSFARIKDRETLSFFAEYCKWCKGDVRGFPESAWRRPGPPAEYRFFPFAVKPDSTISARTRRKLSD